MGWSYGIIGAGFVLVVALINLIPVARRLNRAGIFGEYGLVVCVHLFIFGAIYMHVFVYYPFYNVHGDLSWFKWIVYHFGPSLWLNSNMLFNFFRSWRFDPGYVQPSAGGAVLAAASPVQPVRTCKFCRQPKPPRAHHCSTCGRCVLRQDHHCPFAANCIGYHNYHYFFLFNLYTALSGAYAVAICVFPHRVCESHPPVDSPFHALCTDLDVTFHVMFLLSILVTLVLGAFFALLAFMAARGLTTNEFMTRYVWRTERTPAAVSYDLGSARRNLEAVFGPARHWWRYLVPGLGRPQGHVSDADALTQTRC